MLILISMVCIQVRYLRSGWLVRDGLCVRCVIKLLQPVAAGGFMRVALHE